MMKKDGETLIFSLIALILVELCRDLCYKII